MNLPAGKMTFASWQNEFASSQNEQNVHENDYMHRKYARTSTSIKMHENARQMHENA